MTQERRRRVLVATKDRVGERMAGPAIRAWRLAEALSGVHDVELVSMTACERTDERFVARAVTERDLVELERWCDVVLFQGNVLHESAALQATGKVVIADMYDPVHLEQLEQARDVRPDERRRIVAATTAIVNRTLLRGDAFLCASEKQRDLWVGHLAALGRVNPVIYDADPSLRGLVHVVPFGVDDVAPTRHGRAIKGVVPGIGVDDVVLLWGGGVYNWFDPLTLIRAVGLLADSWPTVRLYFLGIAHPNPDVPRMRMATDAVALSDELGLTDRVVFFNSGWVPYERRADYLLDADIGVSTHLDHVETAYSFRTRLLDCFWAGLPVVTTAGDALAEVVADAGAGLAVPPGDVRALCAALELLVSDPGVRERCAAASASLAEAYRWSRVLAPVVRLCGQVERAPDLLDPSLAARLDPARVEIPPNPRSLRGDLGLATSYLREGGAGLLARKAAARARRVLLRR